MHYMQHQQQQQQYSSSLQHESPPLSTTPEQPPTYVNAKQYKRIMQRRTERNVLDEYYERQQQRNKKRATRYQHESRHKHACTRPRGDHGRYLNKQELEQYYKDHPELRPPSSSSSSSSPKSSQGPWAPPWIIRQFKNTVLKKMSTKKNIVFDRLRYCQRIYI